jgi:hypothetical protein
MVLRFVFQIRNVKEGKQVQEPQNQYAPIALFAYNRPWHFRQTVEALLKNKEAADSDLFVFSDGAKNKGDSNSVTQVRQYLQTITGFKSISVVERLHNFGLGKSIIDGVSFVCQKFGRVIVLEDDLITSEFFLQYMNDGLDTYETDSRVASIHGYIYPTKRQLPQTFFLRGADCLGWAAWKRSWNLFEPDGQKLLQELRERNLTSEFDVNGSFPFTQMLKDQIEGRNNSWAIRWHASVFLRNNLTLYSGQSLVKHIGNDGTGTNCGINDLLDTEVSRYQVKVGDIPVAENLEARNAVEEYFWSTKVKASLLQRAIWRIRNAGKRLLR